MISSSDAVTVAISFSFLLPQRTQPLRLFQVSRLLQVVDKLVSWAVEQYYNSQLAQRVTFSTVCFSLGSSRVKIRVI